jgi:hypothetical protein
MGGFFDIPNKPNQLVPVAPKRGHFFFAGQEFPRVKWWKNGRLSRLYLYIIVLVLTNTANGFGTLRVLTSLLHS